MTQPDEGSAGVLRRLQSLNSKICKYHLGILGGFFDSTSDIYPSFVYSHLNLLRVAGSEGLSAELHSSARKKISTPAYTAYSATQ